MTTVYQRNPAVGPGAHVLAIGVGSYPHLIGGTPPVTNMPLGLGQLSSPPVSTKAFIDWCVAPLLNAANPGYSNPLCTLATVEALISTKAPVTIQAPTGPVQLQNAIRANIDAAFAIWLERLKSDDANIGILYFCGHGIMVADHYLLAEDFGVNNLMPWDRAFDVSNTLRAVEREVNGTLFFFIDACRQMSKKVAMTAGATPSSLMVVDLDKPVSRSSATLVRATGEGKLAFAAEGKVSRFTSALVTALSGYCGIKSTGSQTWDVDGETLAAAVRKLLENGSKSNARKQVSDQHIGGTSVPLIRIGTPPLVKVAIDLLPENLRALAKMFMASAKGARFEHDGANGVFVKEVPRGIYDVGAKAPAHEFVDLLLEGEEFIPPIYDLTMRTGP